MKTPSKGTSRRMDREGSVCSTSSSVSSVASSTSTGNSKSKLAVRHQKCLSQSPSSVTLPERRKDVAPKSVGTKSSVSSMPSTPKSGEGNVKRNTRIRNELFDEGSRKEESKKTNKKRPASPDRPTDRKKQAFQCSTSSDRDLEGASGGAEAKWMNISKNLDRKKKVTTATVDSKNATAAAPFAIASRLPSPLMNKDIVNNARTTTGVNTSSKPTKHGDYITKMDKKETTTCETIQKNDLRTWLLDAPSASGRSTNKGDNKMVGTGTSQKRKRLNTVKRERSPEVICIDDDVDDMDKPCSRSEGGLFGQMEEKLPIHLNNCQKDSSPFSTPVGSQVEQVRQLKEGLEETSKETETNDFGNADSVKTDLDVGSNDNDSLEDVDDQHESLSVGAQDNGTENMEIETNAEGEDYSETITEQESGGGGSSSGNVNDIEIEPNGNSATAEIEAESGEDQQVDILNENGLQNQVDIDAAEKVGKTGGMFSWCTVA